MASKPLKYLFTLGIPLTLAGLGLTGMLSPAGQKPVAVAYDTIEVTKGPIRKLVSTSGPVRALVTVSVGSQLSGLIDKLSVDFNSEVKEGDVLATIDNRTFSSKVAQAKADLAAAKAALANQQATLKRGEAVLVQAERSNDRQETLQKKGFATTVAVDNAKRDAEVAGADIEVARAQIESAKAVIAQREASLKQAEIDLERTKIVAPINGTVISRTIDVGQTVAASLQAPELFKIAQDLRRIRIEAQVNEADVGSVAEGNTVTFSVDAYPDKTFEGKVTQVRLAATELANIVTYTVIIEASNNDRKLFPGMTANAQIEVAKKDSVLRVPNDALRFKPRDAAAEPQGNRAEKMLARLKTDLQLSDEQEGALREEFKKLAPAPKPSGPGAQADPVQDAAALRQRMQSAIEKTLGPTLTAEQRPLFDKWKRGRENTKAGAVFVLDGSGKPERRQVRLGIADDQFAEIASGQLNEGERIVLRTHDAKK